MSGHSNALFYFNHPSYIPIIKIWDILFSNGLDWGPGGLGDWGAGGHASPTPISTKVHITILR